ncbi:hypothetical protein [Paracoccus saliphilus]|uniref:Uncharacterized protein n=1 Tax=Paracoccus saliphilus TaxID=405559 RepID=A0ABY7S730_9RHOB|nr:hypothetical protein [Paracoccus saliphilus]WCR02614.1 hypothetical protein JHX88_17405 [Paracoccus saliphilus]
MVRSRYMDTTATHGLPEDARRPTISAAHRRSYAEDHSAPRLRDSLGIVKTFPPVKTGIVVLAGALLLGFLLI